MRSALLRGRDHTRLGITAAVAEGRAAIAISRGGAPKAYRYRDPNEDAALFAQGEGGILLAVADGHGGCDAAEIVADKLLASFAPEWTGAHRPGPARGLEKPGGARARRELNAAILRARRARRRRQLAHHARARAAPPGDDLLAFASLGDSHIFQLTAGEVLELGHAARAPLLLLPRLRVRDGGIAGRTSTSPACSRSPARARSCSSPTVSRSAGSASRCRRMRSPSAPRPAARGQARAAAARRWRAAWSSARSPSTGAIARATTSPPRSPGRELGVLAARSRSRVRPATRSARRTSCAARRRRRRAGRPRSRRRPR